MQKAVNAALKDLRANKITGKEFGQRHSRAMDKHITTLTTNIPDNIAIIATGGYGREELCPYSDIDLLFLIPAKAPANLHENIEKFLYHIWDEGIKIGHAVRTVKECITVSSEDSKTLSALLDARLISGNTKLFQSFQSTLTKSLKPRAKKSYVKGKLEERDARHTRLGDSRYVLEPNIKDGKGGLRDYQTLFWISNVIYNAASPSALKDLKIITKKEQQRFEKDYEFLLTIRCHLHDIAGRAEERIHFDIQPAIAERLGYQHRDNAKSVERFMKHYFLVTKDIGDLTRIIVAAMEESEEQKNRIVQQKEKEFEGFALIGDRLNFAKDQKLKPAPINILRFFHIAQKHDLDIHPAALQKIRRNIKFIDHKLRNDNNANQIFLDILTNKKRAALTLRRMNEAGVLERFIPEFGKVKGLMQFDRYHTYTVDEHTLNAVDIMHKLENGALKEKAPLASKLIQSIENRKTLYVAILLHDICKGREKKKANKLIGQDHSTLGAELALKLAPRFSLSDQGTRLVSWLIFDHLFMSEIAFKRDLQDPKTLDDFLFRIHDSERLKLLTILTICDIMAVGPDTWTDWKDSLLTDLYTLAHNRLSGNNSTASDKKETTALPTISNKTTAEITITQDNTKNATTIRILTHDKPGLFTTLSGALAVSNANIIEARITTHNNGIVEDTFTVQNTAGKQITKEFRHNEIKQTILNTLENDEDLENKVAKTIKKPKTKELVFDVPSGVIIKNDASDDSTYIETYTRDRHGLLFDIARTIQNQNLTITHAKIGTLGLKAVDVFQVTDLKGNKITSDQRLKTLEKALNQALHINNE